MMCYQILAAESWDCFVCNPESLPSNCLLKTRRDWRENVKTVYDPIRDFLSVGPSITTKVPIKVLSLSEGIGTGIFLFMSKQFHLLFILYS